MKKGNLLKIGIITILLIVLIAICTSCSILSSFWGTNSTNTKIDIENLAEYNVGSVVANNTIEACVRVISDFTVGGSAISTAGSGFCISEDGYIVTNRHVVQVYGTGIAGNHSYSLTKTNTFQTKIPAKTIKVAFGNSQVAYEADIVEISKDNELDIAVLKIKTPLTSFPFIEIDKTSQVFYGQEVYTFGNPEGIGLMFTTLKVSNPSLKSSQDSSYEVIMLDGNVNHGNSGGVLLNNNSKAVGLIYARVETASDGSNNVYGIGCAIKAQYIINFLSRHNLKNHYTEYVPKNDEK